MLISFAVIIAVGLNIVSQIDTAASTQILSSNTAAQMARNNISQNTFGAANTLSSAPVIIGAVIVLGIVAMLRR